MNEQIYGLNYDKPRSRGRPEWPGYRKSNEYDGKSLCYFFEVKRKNGIKWKQWKQKHNLKCFKCYKRCIKEAKRLYAQGVKGKVENGEWIEHRKSQISQFFKKKLENYVKVLKTIVVIFKVFKILRMKCYLCGFVGGTMRIFYTINSVLKKLSQHSVILYKDKSDNEESDGSDFEERRTPRLLKLNNYRVNVNKIVNKTVKKCSCLTNDTLNRLNLNVNKGINTINIRNSTMFFFDNLNRKEIFISSCIMTLALIFYALICAGIELNPGPRGNMEVITYNCNGLGDKNKLRNLLLKVNKKVQEGAIIFLQETHIVNTEYLKRIWKNKLISNCIRTNSAGVIILFNNKYEIKVSHEDDEGRYIVAVVEHEEQTIILSNAYFPNDHKAGIVFAEKLYLKILEAQAEFPSNLTICAGDFNTCMSTEDSMRRNESKNEKLLAGVIQGNNKVTKLKDSYRSIHSTEGFTWKRGSIYSRLDYIFISEEYLRKLTSAETDWAFEVSDHAAVKIKINIDEPIRGPGISKINTEILKNNEIEKQIGNELEEMIGQASSDWNPHIKLEFMKMAVRTIFSSKVSELRKKSNDEVKELEEEINQMESLKIKLHKNQIVTTEEKQRRIEAIEKAILTLKTSTSKLKQESINKLSFAFKAKWYEFGEKSNKYFLNLNKIKQNQKSINMIRDENIEYKGQTKVTECITKFYEKLYAKQPESGKEDKDFYKHCPKLDEE